MTVLVGSNELLSRIEPLWYQLQAHHRNRFPDDTWQTLFAGGFDRRKGELLACAHVRIIIVARDGQDVGYGIGSISHEIGTIESLWVQPESRQHHIGQRIVENLLTWMEPHTRHQHLAVLVGNEDVLTFYEKFGFSVYATELVRINHTHQ